MIFESHSRSVPDFEAITRQIVARLESHIGTPSIPGEADAVRETVIRRIAEDLRLIWYLDWEKTGTERE